MTKRRKDRLSIGAEQLALQLLFDASGGTIGKARTAPENGAPQGINVSFQDRRALLDSITKLIEKRHKMNPEDEPEDGINSFRDMLNGDSTARSDGRDTVETETGAPAGDASDNEE